MNNNYREKDSSEMPDFRGEVPEFIKDNLSKQEAYLFETLDKLDKKFDWLATLGKENNRLVRITNGRVKKLEEETSNTKREIQSLKEDVKPLEYAKKAVMTKTFWFSIIGAFFFFFFFVYPAILSFEFVHLKGFFEGIKAIFFG